MSNLIEVRRSLSFIDKNRVVGIFSTRFQKMKQWLLKMDAECKVIYTTDNMYGTPRQPQTAILLDDGHVVVCEFLPATVKKYIEKGDG